MLRTHRVTGKSPSERAGLKGRLDVLDFKYYVTLVLVFFPIV